MALASFYAQAPMLYGIYTPAMAPPAPRGNLLETNANKN